MVPCNKTFIAGVGEKIFILLERERERERVSELIVNPMRVEGAPFISRHEWRWRKLDALFPVLQSDTIVISAYPT